MCPRSSAAEPYPDMMMERNAKRVGGQVRNPTRNQKEQGNDDGTENQKSRETSPEPYLEQNATRVGRQVRNPTRNQKEPANDVGIDTHKSRETSPGTLPGTRRNQQMMMKQKPRRVGRQAPEPYPKPEETSKWCGNRNA